MRKCAIKVVLEWEDKIIRDREALISTLLCRGAHRLPAQPFADAFELNGRVIEIPKKVGPTTLKERISLLTLPPLLWALSIALKTMDWGGSSSDTCFYPKKPNITAQAFGQLEVRTCNP